MKIRELITVKSRSAACRKVEKLRFQWVAQRFQRCDNPPSFNLI